MDDATLSRAERGERHAVVHEDACSESFFLSAGSSARNDAVVNDESATSRAATSAEAGSAIAASLTRAPSIANRQARPTLKSRPALLPGAA